MDPILKLFKAARQHMRNAKFFLVSDGEHVIGMVMGSNGYASTWNEGVFKKNEIFLYEINDGVLRSMLKEGKVSTTNLPKIENPEVKTTFQKFKGLRNYDDWNIGKPWSVLSTLKTASRYLPKKSDPYFYERAWLDSVIMDFDAAGDVNIMGTDGKLVFLEHHARFANFMENKTVIIPGDILRTFFGTTPKKSMALMLFSKKGNEHAIYHTVFMFIYKHVEWRPNWRSVFYFKEGKKTLVEADNNYPPAMTMTFKKKDVEEILKRMPEEFRMDCVVLKVDDKFHLVLEHSDAYSQTQLFLPFTSGERVETLPPFKLGKQYLEKIHKDAFGDISLSRFPEDANMLIWESKPKNSNNCWQRWYMLG